MSEINREDPYVEAAILSDCEFELRREDEGTPTGLVFRRLSACAFRFAIMSEGKFTLDDIADQVISEGLHKRRESPKHKSRERYYAGDARRDFDVVTQTLHVLRSGLIVVEKGKKKSNHYFINPDYITKDEREPQSPAVVHEPAHH